MLLRSVNAALKRDTGALFAVKRMDKKLIKHKNRYKSCAIEVRFADCSSGGDTSRAPACGDRVVVIGTRRSAVAVPDRETSSERHRRDSFLSIGLAPFQVDALKHLKSRFICGLHYTYSTKDEVCLVLDLLHGKDTRLQR